MVVERAGNTAATEKTFLNRPGVDTLIRNQDRCVALHLVRLRQRSMAERGGLLKDGIERLGDRADLSYGCITIPAARPVATSDTESRGLLAAQDALAAGDRARLRRGAGHTRQEATGL